MVDLDPNQILDRFSEVIGAKNDAELNKALDKTSNTAHYWRKRGTIPIEVIAKFCDSEQFAYVLIGEKLVKQNNISQTIQDTATTVYPEDTNQRNEPLRDSSQENYYPQEQVSTLEKKIARLEGQLEQCQATNAQLLNTITELSKPVGTPSREKVSSH